jgi:hypothetical protein
MGLAAGSCSETAVVPRDVSAIEFTPGIVAIQEG